MGGDVYTASLDKIYTAAGKVLADQKVTSWKLKAFKYYSAPFMAPAGSGAGAAFVTTPEEPEINQPTIDAVRDLSFRSHWRALQPPRHHWRRHSRISGRAAG
jgi:hypothetical protein